jgi:hypothetical protein
MKKENLKPRKMKAVRDIKHDEAPPEQAPKTPKKWSKRKVPAMAAKKQKIKNQN